MVDGSRTVPLIKKQPSAHKEEGGNGYYVGN